MLRLFILLCVFLVAGSVLYRFMLQDAGYLLIVWGNTSIEMSLWVALVLLLVIFSVLYLTVKLYRGGINGFLAAKRSLLNRGNKKAHSLMIDGLTDYIEGNWLLARKKLERSAPKVDSPLINYLAAARSAYELGDEKQALQLLHKAEEATDKPSLAIALTQAKMQLYNQQYEQSLATMERASSINANHPQLLELKRQAYVALHDWRSLQRLLPLLNKHAIGSTQDRHQLSIKVYRELLLNATRSKDGLSALIECWKSLPNDLKQDEHLLALYAEQLIAAEDYERAERILSDALNNHWHESWIRLYGLLNGSSTKKALTTAEKWTKQHNSAGLFLTLGRLCMDNEQWGRAIDFLNKSLAIKPYAETYAAMARVQEQLGQLEDSQENYKKGLLFFTKENR